MTAREHSSLTDTEPREIEITIDGWTVRATRGETALDLARRIGIRIPTLCHHPALEPYGACRLCLVEAVRGKRRRLVAACEFPVDEGVEIVTASETVARHRRAVVELLLARCPGVPALVDLAREMGAREPSDTGRGDTCILCGLCVRVCEAYATSAVTSTGRGDGKRVGDFSDVLLDRCVACGACARLCPTGHVVASREAGAFRVWDRSFSTTACSVDAERCRGCGACEEACPFRVPRVAMFRQGARVARIDRDACRGCGVCVAACPSGAIERAGLPSVEMRIGSGEASRRRALVVACPRAGLSSPGAPRLPRGVSLLELPCTGGVTNASILEALARGADGVLVLGRHEETCRYEGGEVRARETVARAEALARLAGLGAGRVAFAEPARGTNGPSREIEAFLERLDPSPLGDSMPETVSAGFRGLDAALAVLEWLADRPELAPDPGPWLASNKLPPTTSGRAALVVGALPYLDILAGGLIRPASLAETVTDALAVLASMGIEAGVSVGGCRGGFERHAAALAGTPAISLCEGCASRLRESGVQVRTFAEVVRECGGKLPRRGDLSAAIDATNPALAEALSALGVRAFDVGAGPSPLPLAVSPTDRAIIEARLVRAQAAAIPVLVAGGPVDLVQQALFVRRGAWSRYPVRPIMLPTLAARLLAGNTEAA